MSKSGLVFPVQPGKQSLIHEVASQLKQRRTEYEESRRRAGISVERAYLQHNPDDSRLVIAYIEADRTFGEAMQAMVTSDSPLDRDFIDKNSEATGLDFRSGPPGPGPELIGEWAAPGATARQRGFAFAAPLQPGQAEAGRQFAREAYVTRGAELAGSRLATKLAREEVFLNQTPVGDIVVIYLEGEDPLESNRRFAASDSPFDRWFKERCKEIFPSYVDFNQPVPANEELLSWVRSG